MREGALLPGPRAEGAPLEKITTPTTPTPGSPPTGMLRQDGHPVPARGLCPTDRMATPCVPGDPQGDLACTGRWLYNAQRPQTCPEASCQCVWPRPAQGPTGPSPVQPANFPRRVCLAHTSWPRLGVLALPGPTLPKFVHVSKSVPPTPKSPNPEFSDGSPSHTIPPSLWASCQAA